VRTRAVSMAEPPSLSHRRARLGERLGRWREHAAVSPPLRAEGRLVRMVGMTLEAVGCEVPVGGRCRIVGRGHAPVLAEAVGFAADRTFLMPVGPSVD
jgi:flagellum-specific ATP synthase